MKTGIELITDERAGHAYDQQHDDEHTAQEIAFAAACYAAPEPIFVCDSVRRGVRYLDPWPWGIVVRGRAADDADGFIFHTTEEKKRNKDRIRQLVIAGSLCAAEIDRLQRATPPPSAGASGKE